MKIELGKTYETKLGCTVKIYKIDGDDEEYPVIGVFFDPDKERWVNCRWTSEGIFNYRDTTEWCPDLIEVYPTEG